METLKKSRHCLLGMSHPLMEVTALEEEWEEEGEEEGVEDEEWEEEEW